VGVKFEESYSNVSDLQAHVEIKDNQIVIEGPTEEVAPLTAELEAWLVVKYYYSY